MASIDWLNPEDLYVTVCRPALPKDAADMIELTSTIWEGKDYVPYVWDEWLVDYEGLLAVAEYGGRVVGLGKLTLLTSGEWWMEGLRVHPDYEGRGIGSRLHDYVLEYWESNADGLIRLSTVSSREPVKHLSERSGFRVIGEFTFFKAPVIGEKIGNFRLLTQNDVQAALEFTSKSPNRNVTYGLMELGWQWAEPSEQLLSEAVNRGQAWWWDHPNLGLGLLTGRDDFYESSALYIQSLLCEQEAMLTCLQDIRRLGAAADYQKVGWIAPLLSDLVDILDQADFKRDWDESILVYEKSHPSG